MQSQIYYNRLLTALNDKEPDEHIKCILSEFVIYVAQVEQQLKNALINTSKLTEVIQDMEDSSEYD